MSPITRRSEFSSRVTIYESNTTTNQSTSTSTSSTSSTTNTNAIASSSNIKKTPTKRTRSKTEEIIEVEEQLEEDIKPKKSPSPRKPKAFVNSLIKPHPAPNRWQEAYDTIKEQRKRITAAVDLMGCVQGGRESDEIIPNEKDNKLSILVSLMLSSQTKDPVTHQATMNLRNQLRGGLTVDSLLDSTPEEINACISKVGFHNIKTANLAKLALKLKTDYNGEVPEDLNALLALNGVGPKMAILFLNSIGIQSGIGVDVHVHRITNRLGWHKPTTTTPEQTRLNLESWLPKELHSEINILLVGFGQEICRPVGPRCDMCDLSKISRLCPSKQIISPKKIAARSPDKKKIKLDAMDLLNDDDGEEGKPRIEVSLDVNERVIVKGEDEIEDVAKVEAGPSSSLNW